MSTLFMSIILLQISSEKSSLYCDILEVVGILGKTSDNVAANFFLLTLSTEKKE